MLCYISIPCLDVKIQIKRQYLRNAPCIKIMVLQDTKAKILTKGTNISVEPTACIFWAEGMRGIISRMTIIQFNTTHTPLQILPSVYHLFP